MLYEVRLPFSSPSVPLLGHAEGATGHFDGSYLDDDLPTYLTKVYCCVYLPTSSCLERGRFCPIDRHGADQIALLALQPFFFPFSFLPRKIRLWIAMSHTNRESGTYITNAGRDTVTGQ